MPQLEAKEKLESGDLMQFGADELYDLAIAAGLGEATANSYRCSRIRADWKK